MCIKRRMRGKGILFSSVLIKVKKEHGVNGRNDKENKMRLLGLKMARKNKSFNKNEKYMEKMDHGIGR